LATAGTAVAASEAASTATAAVAIRRIVVPFACDSHFVNSPPDWLDVHGEGHGILLAPGTG
jgi:hypothetical protein